jgi:hypothetical protein
MAKSNPYSRQINNRNFLIPTGFKFILSNYPKVDFFSNEASLPGITLGTAIQPTYLKDIDIPGDKLQYEDFTLTFIVDEDMSNYLEIHNWLRGLGYPESLKEIYDLKDNDEYNPNTVKNSDVQYYSDGTLIILSSNLQPRFHVKFYEMFPVNLTPLRFNAKDTDINYFTAEVTFKYTLYDIVDTFGQKV